MYIGIHIVMLSVMSTDWCRRSIQLSLVICVFHLSSGHLFNHKEITLVCCVVEPLNDCSGFFYKFFNLLFQNCQAFNGVYQCLKQYHLGRVGWGRSILTHTYPHKPLRKIKWPSAITRLTPHFMYGLMSALVICKKRRSMVIHDR